MDKKFKLAGFLAGCAIGAGLGVILSVSSPSGAEATPEELAFTMRARVSWEAPTARENGIPLAPEELSAFTIYIQDAAAIGPREIIEVDPSKREEEIQYIVWVSQEDVFDNGETRVAVALTATDLDGRESLQSASVVVATPVPQEVFDLLDRLGELPPGEEIPPPVEVVAPLAPTNLNVVLIDPEAS